MYAQIDTLVVHFQSHIYSNDAANEIIELIQNDLATIEEAIGIQSIPVTIYVAELIVNGIFSKGNAVYCTMDSIIDNTYREMLVSAYFGGEIEPWQKYGIFAYTWDNESDDIFLKKFENWHSFFYEG